MKIDVYNKELIDTYDLFNSGEIVVLKWKNEDNFPLEYISSSISRFGYDKNDFLKKHIEYKDIIHKDDIKKVFESTKEYTKNKTTHYLQKYRIITKSGEERWVFDYTKNIFDKNGNIVSHIGYLVDMSEFINYQNKLEDTLNFLHRLIEAIPAPIFVKDKELKYSLCNRHFENFLQLSKDEIIGKSVYDISPKDLANIYNSADLELIEQKEQKYESSIQDKNGNTKDVIFFKSVLNNKDDSFNGIMGIILDITERKNLERTIQKERLFSETIFNAQENIILINDGEKVEDANSAFLKFFNVKDVNEFLKDANCICEYFINKDGRDYIDNTRYAKIWIDIVLSNQNIEYKAIIKDKDGIDKTFRIDVKKLDFYDETKYIVMLYDITKLINYQNKLEIKLQNDKEEMRENEKILIQQSKMAIMGEMIGAIAHQWRQPLNSIALLIQSIELAYEDELINKKFIDELEHKCMKQITFMSSTINDFRNFFEPNRAKEPFFIKKSIEKIVTLVIHQLKSNNIEIEISGDDFEVLGFYREFQQVMLNLINNSKDSILTKREKSNYIGKIEIAIDSSNKIVSVIDNGTGIKKEISDKIYEPYFTTKGKDGTGIGLYMSNLILQSSTNATLSFQNIENGVIFSIKFNT
jgi:PAS domain S-box-containing protein